MQIQKVQSTQPSFGTRVQVDSSLVKFWQKNEKHAKEFLNYTNKLEQNGKNDVMDIRQRTSWDNQVMAIAKVYEIKGNDIYVSNEIGYDAISWLPGTTECVAIDKMYEECRGKMRHIKNIFKQLPFIS